MQSTDGRDKHVCTTLGELATHTVRITAATRTELVKQTFDQRPDLPGVIVVEEDRLLGVISRDLLFRRLSGPFCRELFLRKPIRQFAAIWCQETLRLEASCSIHYAAELALARHHAEAYEPILVDFGDQRLGLLDVHTLLVAQSQLLSLSKLIEAQRDAAEEASRAKTDFLANISHELRTPLHGILSYARFGLTEVEEADRCELREFFTNVSQSADTLLTLVNDLLDLSKLEAGRMTYSLHLSNLDDLVGAVIDEFRSMCARQEIAFVFSPGDDNTTLVDPDRFKQVIRNLLSNAVKYTPPRGAIHVRSRRVYKPSQSPQHARDTIVGECGRHFDPVLVEAFLARFDDFCGVDARCQAWLPDPAASSTRPAESCEGTVRGAASLLSLPEPTSHAILAPA